MEIENLRDVVRSITSRDWRCHRRKLFFKRLFKTLREVCDKEGNHISGYIQCDDECYIEACRTMAGSISFHPFEDEIRFYIGDFFKSQWQEDLYDELGVKIIRTSPIWKLILGYGSYDVFVFGIDDKKNPIRYQYHRKIWPI